MKVLPISQNYNLFNTNFVSLSSANKISFLAKKGEVDSFTKIYSEREIEDFNHYREKLNYLKKNSVIKYSHYGKMDCSLIDGNLKYLYKNVPFKLIGLIPYCGGSDISKEMNNYLCGDSSGIYPDDELKMYCELFDYSLGELDKKYGKYDGIVYRGGLFDPEVNRYYSTSVNQNMGVLLAHANDSQINIIKTKNGHKIYEVQDKFLVKNIGVRESYTGETEVLITNPQNYVDVTDKLDPNNLEDSRLISCMNSVIEDMKRIKDNPYLIWLKGKSYEEIEDMVRVYVEK